MKIHMSDKSYLALRCAFFVETHSAANTHCRFAKSSFGLKGFLE